MNRYELTFLRIAHTIHGVREEQVVWVYAPSGREAEDKARRSHVLPRSIWRLKTQRREMAYAL